MTNLAEHLDHETLSAMRDMGDDEIDPNALTVEELREEIEARDAVINEVDSIILDNDSKHLPMDRVYRLELLENRRAAISEKRTLCNILNHKTQPKSSRPPVVPPSIQLERERTAMAAKLEKERLKTERHIAAMKRDQNANYLFLRAAVRILDQDQIDAIWARARELWPDSPAWSEAHEPEGKREPTAPGTGE